MLFYSRLIQWNPSITKKNKRGEREEGEGVGDMMILFNNQGLIRRESGWGGGGREEGGGVKFSRPKTFLRTHCFSVPGSNSLWKHSETDL